MEVFADPNVSGFNESLYQLARAVKKPFGQVVKQNARLLGINLAIMVQPWAGKEGNFAQMKSGSLKYNGLEDRRMGESAVRRDVGRCYMNPGHLWNAIVAAGGRQDGERLAKAFWAMCLKRDAAGAQKLLRSIGIYSEVIRFDAGKRHTSARNNRGRVGRSTSPAVVLDPKAMTRYREKIVRHVGIGKGGFAGAANALGGMRGLPQWVTRHKSHGRATDRTNGDDPHAILHNDVPWIDTLLSPSGAQMAVDITEGKMLTHIRYVVSAEARKAGLEVTPWGEEQRLLAF